jgi:hypothetical protein
MLAKQALYNLGHIPNLFSALVILEMWSLKLFALAALKAGSS